VSLLAPLGLLALVALPAVVILHLYRRRLRQRRVAGLFLFRADELTASAGRRRTRLLRSLSLLLELLAALCAALLLSRPSLGLTGQERHVVIVLDDSARWARSRRRARRSLGRGRWSSRRRRTPSASRSC
jgi:hypothetical protein